MLQGADADSDHDFDDDSDMLEELGITKSEVSPQVAPANGHCGSIEDGSPGTDDGDLPGGTTEHAFGTQVKPKPISSQEMSGERGNCIAFLGQGAAGHISTAGEAQWQEIEITVDSGACDTVMPAYMCADIRIDPSDPQQHCSVFEVANGAFILNMGERRCVMMTEGSGVPKHITFQVADVHKPLLSVSRLADNGYQCVLGDKNGHLEDVHTGEKIPLIRRDNLYVMKAWLRASSGFARQG